MLGSTLYKIGGYVLFPIGYIHDALKGMMPVATSQTINLTHEAESDQAWADTVKYYIGGTFVVTLVLAFFIFRKKKKRSYTRKRTTAKRTMRRRTYKKRKK